MQKCTKENHNFVLVCLGFVSSSFCCERRLCFFSFIVVVVVVIAVVGPFCYGSGSRSVLFTVDLDVFHVYDYLLYVFCVFL